MNFSCSCFFDAPDVSKSHSDVSNSLGIEKESSNISSTELFAFSGDFATFNFDIFDMCGDFGFVCTRSAEVASVRFLRDLRLKSFGL